ncbi:MAG TPA: hypothetical protein PKA82_05270 [Pyrinomonadaceae bacterium]|nr:hypothetical protein [Pyrinomonadaceae bacterium]
MTDQERHLRDLNYLLKKIEPDMSPEAITERMEKLNNLCSLSILLGLPDIEYFDVDQFSQLGQLN